MRVEYVTETAPRVLDLSEEEADAFAAAGKRLAGSEEYWGRAVTDANGPFERTVIRCDRLAHGRYRVTVAEAVGIVVLPSLTLIVEPKIPLAHFRYLLERSPAFPRLDDQQAGAAESSELWDLVATWFVAALERLLRHGLVADYQEQEDLPYVRGTVQAVETANAYYQGRVSFSCLNCDDADDLPGRVRADDAGRSGRCRLLGRHGELGGVGMVAAVLVHGDGDVVSAGWFGHVWDSKSGI